MGRIQIKMKILALVLASAQAYTVFDVGTDCTEGGSECGTNEVCVELKCACAPGWTVAEGTPTVCDVAVETTTAAVTTAAPTTTAPTREPPAEGGSAVFFSIASTLLALVLA